MLKACGSNKDLETLDFYNYIEEIIYSQEVQQLKNYQHHIYTTRFQHSLNVSYYNYLICKKLKLNAKAAARAGLLHDLFFYDTKDYVKNPNDKSHIKGHPQLALKNALEKFEISLVEKDIIVKHMWPITLALPKYKESFVIVFVDKYCAILEYFLPYLKLFRRKKSLKHNQIKSTLAE